MRLEEEIQSSFKNGYHKAVLNIRFTNNHLNAYFESIVSGRNITSQQYNVLRILQGQKGNAIPVSLIKERLLDRNADASRIVSRLEKKKLVVREESKLDRRQKLVKISSKGSELVQNSLFIDDEAENVLSNLNQDEVQQLNKLLDKIRNK